MSTSQFLPAQGVSGQRGPGAGRGARRLLTGVGGVAVAVVVVDVVEAGAPVAAGLRRALVDVDGAVVPGVPGAGALARVAVQPVHAAAAVLARARLRATDTRQYLYNGCIPRFDRFHQIIQSSTFHDFRTFGCPHPKSIFNN